MQISIRLVQEPADIRNFVCFPWKIYQDDPFWVPPLIEDRIAKLDLKRNPFWKTATRSLWMAWNGSEPVGTIAAIIDHHRNQLLAQSTGMFGFFECIDDEMVAKKLFETAANWLKQQGMTRLIGPFNPGSADENGILIEGFNTRPAILEAHTPPYYPHLVEAAGLTKYNDMFARLYVLPEEPKEFEKLVPEKLQRAAELARKRTNIIIRSVNLKDWENEINLACDLYNRALSDLPEYIPMSHAEFRNFADSFKPLISPDMAKVAEINGKPVGFALALPDFNEILQKLNGKLGIPGLLKIWWYRHKIKRVSFKILIIIPEYLYRGADILLVYEVARAIWARKYREVDMSLMGEENQRSNLYQEHLGFKIYRQYRIYQKDL